MQVMRCYKNDILRKLLEKALLVTLKKKKNLQPRDKVLICILFEYL